MLCSIRARALSSWPFCWVLQALLHIPSWHCSSEKKKIDHPHFTDVEPRHREINWQIKMIQEACIRAKNQTFFFFLSSASSTGPSLQGSHVYEFVCYILSEWLLILLWHQDSRCNLRHFMQIEGKRLPFQQHVAWANSLAKDQLCEHGQNPTVLRCTFCKLLSSLWII